MYLDILERQLAQYEGDCLRLAAGGGGFGGQGAHAMLSDSVLRQVGGHRVGARVGQHAVRLGVAVASGMAADDQVIVRPGTQRVDEPLERAFTRGEQLRARRAKYNRLDLQMADWPQAVP